MGADRHGPVEVTRDLDPTRLILDESGGWAFGANMYLPYAYEPMKFNDIHNYPGPLINERLFNGYLTIGMTDEEEIGLFLKRAKAGELTLGDGLYHRDRFAQLTGF